MLIGKSIYREVYVVQLGKAIIIGSILCLDTLSTVAVAQNYLEEIPPAYAGQQVNNVPEKSKNEIYLDIYINEEKRNSLAAVIPASNGQLFIRPSELEKAGIKADRSAINKDGWVDLTKLSNVSFFYDEPAQALMFDVSDDSVRSEYISTVQPNRFQQQTSLSQDDEGKPQSDPALTMNYTIYADSNNGNFSDMWSLNGVSANLETKFTSKLGVFYNSQIAKYSSDDDTHQNDFVRLDSYWSYSDPESMMTYRVGDLISRNLSWGRSVRLGGVQWRRNYDIRSDLVTMPLPQVSGSAAVPSAVDVYVNGTRRATSDVPTGPFVLTDIPAITGAGTARVVTRDALGRESVSEFDYFASNEMLAEGLLDFSFEAGVPRRNVGQKSADYKSDFFGSATARYGWTNAITLEGHIEGGDKLVNAGGGATVMFGALGTISMSAASSQYGSETGYQWGAGFDIERWGIKLRGQTQRSYEDYNDIASVVDRRYEEKDDDDWDEWNDWGNWNRYYSYKNDWRVPKAINQLSISIPLKIDPATLNFSYTEVDNWNTQDSKILSFSTSRSFGKNISTYVSAFTDLDDSKSIGVFAGLTYRFDNKRSANFSLDYDKRGTSGSVEYTKSSTDEIGDFGYRLRNMQGERENREVAGNYNTPMGRAAASIQEYNDKFRGTAQWEGSLIVADGSIMPANRIYDSFAIVDAGAPNVLVKYENRPYGRTGYNGKLIVPNLNSYQKNRITIDPQDLPVDALIESTEAIVTPADQSAVKAKFGVDTSSDYIMASLVDESGNAIPAGSLALLSNDNETQVVGYDGLVIVKGKIGQTVQIKIKQSLNGDCEATVKLGQMDGLLAGMQTYVCRAG